MRATILGWSFLPLACLGCGGGSDAVTNPVSTQMTLRASPGIAETEQPVNLTITASNAQRMLVASRIDFEDDGVWDETRTHNASSITTTFSHAYLDAGEFTARAEVFDESDAATARTIVVTVHPPVLVPVTFTVAGISSSALGTCYADGSPFTCASCWYPLVGESDPRPLGTYRHGAAVGFQQGFRQDRFIADSSTVGYDCVFNVHIYAGAPGSEALIGGGFCQTDPSEQVDDPAARVCTANAHAVVP